MAARLITEYRRNSCRVPEPKDRTVPAAKRYRLDPESQRELNCDDMRAAEQTDNSTGRRPTTPAAPDDDTQETPIPERSRNPTRRELSADGHELATSPEPSRTTVRQPNQRVDSQRVDCDDSNECDGSPTPGTGCLHGLLRIRLHDKRQQLHRRNDRWAWAWAFRHAAEQRCNGYPAICIVHGDARLNSGICRRLQRASSTVAVGWLSARYVPDGFNPAPMCAKSSSGRLLACCSPCLVAANPYWRACAVHEQRRCVKATSSPAAIDSCHKAGTCNSDDGTCSDPCPDLSTHPGDHRQVSDRRLRRRQRHHSEVKAAPPAVKVAAQRSLGPAATVPATKPRQAARTAPGWHCRRLGGTILGRQREEQQDRPEQGGRHLRSRPR